MDHNQKILDQKNKIAAIYADSQEILDYLFETLNNFYYRYLETTQVKDLSTSELSNGIWGAESYETSAMEILKIKNPLARIHLINAAKQLGAQKGLEVHYSLFIKPKSLTTENGEIEIYAKIDWSQSKVEMEVNEVTKMINFKYQSLSEFRKQLALKLEDICDFFI